MSMQTVHIPPAKMNGPAANRRAGILPPCVLAFSHGFGSGVAMILYSIVKEVNPDYRVGDAYGVWTRPGAKVRR